MRETTTAPFALRAANEVRNSVVVGELAADRAPAAGEGWECIDADGNVYPAQITQTGDGSRLVGVYVEHLEAGRDLSLDLRPGATGDLSRGIELWDQPENGRVVVNYSGFLQTIYHYGRENFKPRFYPLTAPCGRMGDIDGDQTVYPKSITDDSPPDHIWHRSLWYACGDLNGVDFYLENGGEGRIVHRRVRRSVFGPVVRRLSRAAPLDSAGWARTARRRAFLRDVPVEGPAPRLRHRGVVHGSRSAGDVRPDERERAAADPGGGHHRRVGRRDDNACRRHDRRQSLLREAVPLGRLQRAARAARKRAGSVRHRDAGPPIEPKLPERVVRPLVRAAGHQPPILRWPADVATRRDVAAQAPDSCSRG